MNMFMIWMIVFGIATMISVCCISAVSDFAWKLFFIGLSSAFLIATGVFVFAESNREEALNRYVIVKAVTYGDTANTFKYSTNYPAFGFISDSLIYKPGDTVWLGVK